MALFFVYHLLCHWKANIGKLSKITEHLVLLDYDTGLDPVLLSDYWV